MSFQTSNLTFLIESRYEDTHFYTYLLSISDFSSHFILEIFDGIAVLTDRHVAEANVASSISQGELYKIQILSSGARGLLVAMVCYGISDTFTKQGCNFSVMGALPMNMAQIRGSFSTLIEIKKQTKGIAIGHECTEMNVRRWISELHDVGLIKSSSGSRSLGVGRSFNGGRSEKVFHDFLSYHFNSM